MKAYSQITFDFTEVEQEGSSKPSLGVRIKSLKVKEPVAEEVIELPILTEIADPEPIIQTETAPVKSTRGRKSQKTFSAEADLIRIPTDEVLFQKQYYSIGEVSTMFNVNASLLRFWESEFPVIQPKKNRKGDRHFRPIDIKNLQLIYDLLRRRKLTIDGARDFLKQNKKSQERFELIQSLQKVRSYLLELKANL